MHSVQCTICTVCSWELRVEIIVFSDVNRGSKNRNSLQFPILEIEFLNSKLDVTF